MSLLNTIKLKYWETGEGKVCVIFLHGYPLDHTIWHPLIPYLKVHARLIMPDLRGHGESPVPHGVYHMDAMAADVAGLMDELKIEQAVLIGHSLGGYISFAFARSFPQRLSGLGLVATQAGVDTEEKRQNRMNIADQLERDGLGSTASNMPGNLTTDPKIQVLLREIILKANPYGAANTQRGMALREDSRILLESIQVPTVVVAGEKDGFVPLTVAQDMAERLPSAQFVMVPDAGHMPMMEAPEITSRSILDMIQRVEMIY